MANTDMLDVRSGKDADEAVLPAWALRFRLAIDAAEVVPSHLWCKGEGPQTSYWDFTAEVSCLTRLSLK